MSITDSEIKRIAKLSMLDIPQEQYGQLRDEMGAIIDMVNRLETLDIGTDEGELDISRNYNVMREDVIVPSADREQLLANAPAAEQGCFFVPKIVE